jgi:hypothetical protein
MRHAIDRVQLETWEPEGGHAYVGFQLELFIRTQLRQAVGPSLFKLECMAIHSELVQCHSAGTANASLTRSVV